MGLTWDKPCLRNEDCPFYKKNMNYPNNFGQCINGFCEMPLGEIIFEFFEKMKSMTKGYASLDYAIIDHRKTNLRIGNMYLKMNQHKKGLKFIQKKRILQDATKKSKVLA